MKENSELNTGDVFVKLDAMSKRLAVLEAEKISTGTYKQLQESISQAVNQVLQSPRVNDAVMERVRALSMGRDDLTAFITRSVTSKTADYLNSEIAQQAMKDTLVNHPMVSSFIDGTIQSAVAKREFVTALATAFRTAIVQEPLQLAALVDELAKDEKGLLAKSLAGNTGFMDKHSQSILTWLRDSLA